MLFFLRVYLVCVKFCFKFNFFINYLVFFFFLDIDADNVKLNNSTLSFPFYKNKRSWRFNETSELSHFDIELFHAEAAEWTFIRLKRTLRIIKEVLQDELSNSLTFSGTSFLFKDSYYDQ